MSLKNVFLENKIIQDVVFISRLLYNYIPLGNVILNCLDFFSYCLNEKKIGFDRK